MQAENETTEHNRTIHLTGIPGRGSKGDLSELYIQVKYIGEGHPGPTGTSPATIDMAVTLDNVVIPAIITAINGGSRKVRQSGIRVAPKKKG